MVFICCFYLLLSDVIENKTVAILLKGCYVFLLPAFHPRNEEAALTLMHITPAYVTVRHFDYLLGAWERYGHRADIVPGIPGLIRFRCTEPLTKAQLRKLPRALRKILAIGPDEGSIAPVAH